MSENIRKKHTGEPGNGGQFGTVQRAETTIGDQVAGIVERSRRDDTVFDLYCNGRTVPGNWRAVRAQGTDIVVTDGENERTVYFQQLTDRIPPSNSDVIFTIQDCLRDWDYVSEHGEPGPEEVEYVRQALSELARVDSSHQDRAIKALRAYYEASDAEEAGGQAVPVDVEQDMVDVLRDARRGMEDDFEISADERKVIRDQIGMMNVFAISGGKVTPLKDGIELPVSNGYRVRVRLRPNDTYTVERVFVRAGKEFPKGHRDNIYADEVGQKAYYASCFRNDDGEWTYMG